MEITSFGASHLSQLIHSKQVSCQEVMQASLARIAQVNPRVNAIVNLRPADELLMEARQHDALLAQAAAKAGCMAFLRPSKTSRPAPVCPTPKAALC
jgi:amidase